MKFCFFFQRPSLKHQCLDYHCVPCVKFPTNAEDRREKPGNLRIYTDAEVRLNPA